MRRFFALSHIGVFLSLSLSLSGPSSISIGRAEINNSTAQILGSSDDHIQKQSINARASLGQVGLLGGRAAAARSKSSLRLCSQSASPFNCATAAAAAAAAADNDDDGASSWNSAKLSQQRSTFLERQRRKSPH